MTNNITDPTRIIGHHPTEGLLQMKAEHIEHAPIAEPTRVCYTVNLYITRDIRYDLDAPMREQADWRLSNDAKSELVRELQRAINSARFSSSAVDGDISYEVIDAEIVTK